jgi:hypothetical protein
MTDRQITADRQRRDEVPNDPQRIGSVGEVVQHAAQHDHDGLGEVQTRTGAGDDHVRITQVGFNVNACAAWCAGQ